MKNFPYDIPSLKTFDEIKYEDLNLFSLNRRRKVWDLIASELIKIKFHHELSKEFFTTISLQLYNEFAPIICTLIEYENYYNKNIQLKFNNKIINKIIIGDLKEEFFFENFCENYNFKKANKIRIFLRNIYFLGNFYKNKIDLIDHNYNSRKFLKDNYNINYKPSNNFFNFDEIINDKYNYSEEFKLIFDENFRYLEKIFINCLSEYVIKEKFVNNFSFFLKCFLKFEINIFLQARKILKKSKINYNISSSISGFKPSRLITSYVNFKGGKVLKFDDQNGGILHGNHKAAYLNNFINCTDFYFTTNNGKEIAENFYTNFLKKNKLNKKISFHSLNYKEKFNLKKKNLPYKKVKFVYFTISFRNVFHGSGSFHDLDYLKIQNIIFNFFRSNTSELLYRAPPETLIGIKKNPLEKYLNNLNFKDTIKNSNICIFDTTLSSAFWQCIQNQNPIILIRHYNVDDESPYFERLEKRCEIIDISDPKQTEEILNNINFQKISKNSIDKSYSCYDNFDNIIL